VETFLYLIYLMSVSCEFGCGSVLFARYRPDFAGSFPEAERAVGNSRFRPHNEFEPFQIEQKIAPILRTFPYAVSQADEFLAPSGIAPRCFSSLSRACRWMPSAQT
jgi:hypothetical protein